MQLDRMGEERDTKGEEMRKREEVQDGEVGEGFPIFLRHGLPVCHIVPYICPTLFKETHKIGSQDF